LAKTPRKWTGARTPSGLKRVRTSERRHAVLQPRRSAAKTLVAKALRLATTSTGTDGTEATVALSEAASALDRAAKAGAIHPNAAARRKSRLARKVSAALEGTHVQAGARVTKTTGKAAAAKARVAASKAVKAKGAQTAAGKARAALSKTARTEAAGKATASAAATPAAPSKPASRAKSSTKAKSTDTAPTAKTKTPAKPAASRTKKTPAKES